MDIQPNSSPPLFDKSNPNIQVLVRVRPLNSRESQEGSRFCLSTDPNDPRKITLDSKPEPKLFYFDFVAGKDVSQDGLFEIVGKPLAQICMEGYNICIFAYGQTGAGKTYTMQGRIGENEELGLQPKVFEYLFQLIEKEVEAEFNLKVSYLEIYNEQINDLLKNGNTGLQVREDLKKGPYVEGLTEEKVTSGAHMMEIMMRGLKNRHIGSTYMNFESSRSHSIFTITMESQKKVNNVINQRVSKLNFVDLAGSERQKQSGTSGNRLKEAGNINKSLTILGCVINSLAESNQRKTRHIPYRDSKLTFILRDSLGGNSKTCMIAAISASSSSFCETLSTLKFAQRAKMIRNRACVNEEMTGNAEILKLEIKRLKEELQQSLEIVGNWKMIYETNEKELEKERFFWVLLKKSGQIFSELIDVKAKSLEFSSELREKLSENGVLMKEIAAFLLKILNERTEIRAFLEKTQPQVNKTPTPICEKSQTFDEFPSDLDDFLRPFLSYSVSESERARFESLQSDLQRMQEEFEILQTSYIYEKEESKRKSENLRVFEKKSQEDDQKELTTRSLIEENEKYRGQIESLNQVIEEKEMDLAVSRSNEGDLRKALEEIEMEKVGLLDEKRALEDEWNREAFEFGEEKQLLSDKLEALVMENEMIKSERQAVIAEIQGLKCDYEALKVEKEKGNAEIEELRCDLEVMKGERNDKIAEVEGLKRGMEALRKEKSDLEEEKERQGKVLEERHAEIANLQEEKQKLIETSEEKSREIEVLETENRVFCEEIDVFKAKNADLISQILSKTKEFELISQQNNLLNEQLAVLKEEISGLKLDNEKISTELKDRAKKCEDLISENLSFQGKIESENLKMNEFLVTIKEKLRVRDQRIEALKQENELKEEELFKTAMNLQEILKGSEESFKELKNLKEIKQENERMCKTLEDFKMENERLEDLYKKLDYQANIMKANYKIKENEARKLQEEKKLADLLISKFERKTKILEEQVRNMNLTSKTLDFDGFERNFNFGLKKENIALKSEIINLKEIIDTHRRKMEELAKKNLMDPKKVFSQIDENVKLRTDLKELKQEQSEIHRLMTKIQRICSEDNSEIVEQDENYEPLKIVNSLSAWISTLKERENRVFEKENQLQFQETRLRFIKEEYALYLKKIELKKTEFSPHRLEKFIGDYERRSEEKRRTESLWAKSERIHKKTATFDDEEYFSLPKKKIKMF